MTGRDFNELASDFTGSTAAFSKLHSMFGRWADAVDDDGDEEGGEGEPEEETL